jgi:hypothetical protein
MLEAELTRKSTRRDKRYRSLPPTDETKALTEDEVPQQIDETKALTEDEVPQQIDKTKETQKDEGQQPSVGESELEPNDEQKIVPTDKNQTTDSISEKNMERDGKD